MLRRNAYDPLYLCIFLLFIFFFVLFFYYLEHGFLRALVKNIFGLVYQNLQVLLFFSRSKKL